jgi:EAL domain-containing protein (putative c-di-GMP-specific phosphodiesterase class I)
MTDAQPDRLASLYRISQTFSSSLDLDEVLDRVMDEVIAATRAERGFLMLRDAGGRLTFRVARGMDQQAIEAPEFQPQPLLGLLARAGISPDRIILEITERQGIDQLDTLRTKLGACRAAGFRIAIDDLGAGNSGLRLLSQIHFDIVKIDLSLVQAGTQRAASLDIVRTLMELAERWGAYAVAEGVESADQLHMLRSIGLGHAQGYLLGRPTSEPSLRSIDIETILGEQGSSAILRAFAASAT